MIPELKYFNDIGIIYNTEKDLNRIYELFKMFYKLENYEMYKPIFGGTRYARFDSEHQRFKSGTVANNNLTVNKYISIEELEDLLFENVKVEYDKEKGWNI